MSNSMVAKQSTTLSHKYSVLLFLGIGQVFLMATSGCRSTTDNQIDLLERELRVQEDYIYELEDYVVEYSDKLRSCRSCPPPQTATYSEELYEPAPAAAPKRAKQSKRRRVEKEPNGEESSVVEPKAGELPEPFESKESREISPEDLEVPELDLEIDPAVSEYDGDQDELQQVAVIDLDRESSREHVLVIPDPLDYEPSEDEPIEDEADQLAAEQDDAYDGEELAGDLSSDDEQFVEDLFADDQVEETAAYEDRVAERLEVKQLFRGEGDDNSPQNLLTVVEALDANDEPVDLDGEVSLMVMTADGENLKRLKRWNFTAEETIAAWQSSELGDGLHLELPLEERNLPEAPLELWVRLVSTDGRKLLTQLPFEASQLSDIASAQPPEEADGEEPTVMARTEAKPTKHPTNTLRIESASNSSVKKLQLANRQTPEDDKPRWRSSMQRTDRTAQGFATTSSKSSGWTRQALGRQPYVPAKVATRPLPAQSNTNATSPQRSQPSWTSGRSVLPTATTQTPAKNAPASWSKSRY